MLELGQDGAVCVFEVRAVVGVQRVGLGFRGVFALVVIGCGRVRGEGRVERSEEGGGVGADFVVFWTRERPDAVRLCEPVEEDEDDPEDGEERVEEDVEANGEVPGKEEGEFENEDGEAYEAEDA